MNENNLVAYDPTDGTFFELEQEKDDFRPLDPTEKEKATNKWNEFLVSVQNGTFHLSFSKIKAFRKSPLHFYRYITKTDKQTDSMKFGQIDHCYILETQDIFNENYIVLDRPTNLKCKASKDGKIGKDEFEQYKERAILEGKDLVKLQDMEKSKYIKEMLLKDDFTAYLIGQHGQSEVSFKYIYETQGGFQYLLRGRIDKIGDGFKLDLKNIANLADKNPSRYVKANLLHVQAAIYQMSEQGDELDDYFILAVDNESFLPIQISKQTITDGKRELEYILTRFEMCYLENRWFESLGFWHDRNFEIV